MSGWDDVGLEIFENPLLQDDPSMGSVGSAEPEPELPPVPKKSDDVREVPPKQSGRHDDMSFTIAT